MWTSRPLLPLAAVALAAACGHPPTGEPEACDCCSAGWRGAIRTEGVLFVSPDGRPVDLGGGVVAPAVASIGEAVALGATRIAVARGTYRESLALGHEADGVRIDGQCREEVVVDGSDSPRKATVAFDGRERDTLELRGVTITGGRPGIEITGGTLVAEDVEVTGNTRVGVYGPGADEGTGIAVFSWTPGSGLALTGSTVCAHPTAALFVAGAGAVHVLDSTLSGSAPHSSPVGPWGNALVVSGAIGELFGFLESPAPTDVVVERSLLASDGDNAVFASDGSLSLVESEVAGPDPQVVQQACGAAAPIVATPTPPSIEACPAYDRPYVEPFVSFTPPELVIVDPSGG